MRFSSRSIACVAFFTLAVLQQSTPTEAGFFNNIPFFSNSEAVGSGDSSIQAIFSQNNFHEDVISEKGEGSVAADEFSDDEEEKSVFSNLRERLFIDIEAINAEKEAEKSALLRGNSLQTYTRRAKDIYKQAQLDKVNQRAKLASNRTTRGKGPARAMNSPPRRPRATMYNGQRINETRSASHSTPSSATASEASTTTSAAGSILKKAINFFGAKSGSPVITHTPGTTYGSDIFRLTKTQWLEKDRQGGNYDTAMWKMSQTYRRMDGGVSSFIYHTLRTYGGRSVNPYFRGLNDTVRNRAFYPSAFQTKVRWEAPKPTIKTTPKPAVKPLVAQSSSRQPETHTAATLAPSTLESVKSSQVSSSLSKKDSKHHDASQSQNSKKEGLDSIDEEGTEVHKLFQILKKKAREQTIRDIAEAIAGTIIREEQENERENFHSIVENAEGWSNTQDILNEVRQVLLTIDEKKNRKGAISAKNTPVYTHTLTNSSHIDEDSSISATINFTGELDDVGIHTQVPVVREQDGDLGSTPIHSRRRIPLTDTEKPKDTEEKKKSSEF